VSHEEFAELVERRLEEAADRLEYQARDLGIDGEASKTKARAGELRVAAHLVREEAWVVSRSDRTAAESREDPAGPPPLKAQA
jgi:frataxin-like iron-binding protein CyaY